MGITDAFNSGKNIIDNQLKSAKESFNPERKHRPALVKEEDKMS